MKPADGAGLLERALAERRRELLAHVRRRAGGALLRIETAEDLVQGICAHALAASARVPQDDEALRTWLLRLAENYLHDRRDYWGALKRGGAWVLRSGLRDGTDEGLSRLGELASSVTGPSTFAVRREQLRLAALALDMLLPRDRELVLGLCRGDSVEEQAARLELGYDATVAARGRALERLRRCFRLALGSG